MISRAATLRGLLVALLTLPILTMSAPEGRAEITVQQIKGLTTMGIAPAEIIKAIEREKTVFNLTVQDILGLKKAGVDKKVLSYMLSTPQRFGKKGAKDQIQIIIGSDHLFSNVHQLHLEGTYAERAVVKSFLRMHKQ